jgi:hypothetical protein
MTFLEDVLCKTGIVKIVDFLGATMKHHKPLESLEFSGWNGARRKGT